MPRAALPERGAARLPSPGAAGKAQFLDRRRAAERGLEAELPGGMAHQADRILTEQPLAGAIDEHQPMVVVEGEDGHVDLGHHRSEQRRRLLRAEALHAKRLGERVDLQHHVRRADRCPAPRARAPEKSPSRSAASRFAIVCSGRADAVAHDRP